MNIHFDVDLYPDLLALAKEKNLSIPVMVNKILKIAVNDDIEVKWMNMDDGSLSSTHISNLI